MTRFLVSGLWIVSLPFPLIPFRLYVLQLLPLVIATKANTDYFPLSLLPRRRPPSSLILSRGLEAMEVARPLR